ncbi:phage tail assembly chaperone [Paenirhodobacter enshiensis]|uniref:phage tail assembly chaperone n=1 Tax=Paenirhodobacter enshiensis TaxID=1105367 RepID=UPI0035AE38F6
MTPAQSRLKDQLCAALVGILRRKKVHIPEAGLPVWEAFLTLTQTRRHHANGPEPISLTEIEAYTRVFAPLDRHHVWMLLAMDLVWLEWASKPKEKREPTVPLTAEMFDFAFGG